MTEATYLAVEVDAGFEPFYWEIYSQSDMAYIATVEAEDFGDYLANNKEFEFVVQPQEPFQVMTAIHIELDKFFGQPDDHLDDCDAIQDPSLPLDPFCEGCKSFKNWTVGKLAGDYFGNPLLCKVSA